MTTHFWIKNDGKKIPLPLMADDHICNAYRRCLEVIYGNQFLVERDGEGRHLSTFETNLTKEKAEKWKLLFEQEAEKRKIRLPKIDKHTYVYDFGLRQLRKRLAYDKNKKFDDKFKK